jgi:phosphoribosyl 1,2-cyclic phosphodiesterase
VSDVFLTHEHGDHAGAAGILGRKLGVRVHATAGTFRALRDPPPLSLCRIVRAGEPVQLGALTVTPVAIPHDACEPVAYTFSDGAASGALVTDLGCVPPVLIRALQGLDALVLEMNHDVRMLLEGPYPWSLKQRVRSGHGHLSNVQGAQLLEQVIHGGLRHLVLAHLSQHNNTERHARTAAEKVLTKFGSPAQLVIGSQARPLDPVLLEGSIVTPLRRARQLALFA